MKSRANSFSCVCKQCAHFRVISLCHCCQEKSLSVCCNEGAAERSVPWPSHTGSDRSLPVLYYAAKRHHKGMSAELNTCQRAQEACTSAFLCFYLSSNVTGCISDLCTKWHITRSDFSEVWPLQKSVQGALGYCAHVWKLLLFHDVD